MCIRDRWVQNQRTPVAAATGVRWFCTHKLAWNADNPFPHRLFRWRARGRSELHSLMLPPIGRRADPLEMLGEQRAWHQATGLEAALWIPGVGDHGGGPTEELLEQMHCNSSLRPCRAGIQIRPMRRQVSVHRQMQLQGRRQQRALGV